MVEEISHRLNVIRKKDFTLLTGNIERSGRGRVSKGDVRRNRSVVSQKPKVARSGEWTGRPELRGNSWVGSEESPGGLNETAAVEWLGEAEGTERCRESEYTVYCHYFYHGIYITLLAKVRIVKAMVFS